MWQKIIFSTAANKTILEKLNNYDYDKSFGISKQLSKS